MQTVSAPTGIHQKLPITQYAAYNDPAPLRHPALDGDSRLLIILAVIIPVLLTFLLCVIAVCIYRLKKRSAQNHKNIQAASIDQHDAAVFEGLPPSYIVVSETKPTPPYSFVPSNSAPRPSLHVDFVNHTK